MKVNFNDYWKKIYFCHDKFCWDYLTFTEDHSFLVVTKCDNCVCGMELLEYFFSFCKDLRKWKFSLRYNYTIKHNLKQWSFRKTMQK